MEQQRRKWVANVALSTLAAWYATWETFSRHGNAEVRQRAICCKAHGLVWHDRHLIRAEEVLHG